MHEPAFYLIDGLVYAIVFLINWAGHWVPWDAIPAFVDERGELHRILAYVHGTLSIFGGVTLGAAIRQMLGRPRVPVWEGVLYMAFCIFSAGVGTIIPYVVDELKERRILAHDVNDYEQTLKG